MKRRKFVMMCGDNHVKFNMKGCVQSVKYKNAIIVEPYIFQLPFNVEMALESGIIKLVEVTNGKKEEVTIKGGEIVARG